MHAGERMISGHQHFLVYTGTKTILTIRHFFISSEACSVSLVHLLVAAIIISLTIYKDRKCKGW
jgi:hypothetical protein